MVWFVRCTIVLLVAVILGATLAAPLFGQAPPPVFELPDVVAPGRRPQRRTATPASISVLTAADLARLGVRTAGDALRFLPEVSVRAFGGPGSLQEVSIRGTATAHVLVLIDGVPVNSPAQGLATLNTIPVDNIERIEVLRGPFSAIYGSGALGGVIHIVTRSKPSRTARTGVASLGTSTASVLWGWQGDRTRITIDAIHDASGGFRTNADYSGQTFAGRLQFGDDAAPSFTVGVKRFQAEQGVPGDTAFPSPLARQGTGRTIVDATWRTSGAGLSSGLLRAYWVGESIRFANPEFGFTSQSDTHTFGVESQLVRQMGPSKVLTLGLEAQRHGIDSVSASAFGTTLIRRDAWVGAAYAVNDITLGPATLVSLGLRYDTHSVYGSQLNPRLGILHRTDDRTILRASLGSTFRGPSFLLLFFPGCSNPNLRPERAWSADVGVERQLSPALVGRATIYATQATDLIQSGCPPVNIQSASMVGGSLEVEGWLTPKLQVLANVSLTTTRDQAGDPLIRVPGLAASASLHFSLTHSSTLSLLANYIGSRPDLDFSTFPATRVTMPAHVLVGVRYSLATDLGTLQVGVDNIFDVTYESVRGFPSPGRTVFVSFARGF
ncbi:MAG: TonB-dependent receptor plug domain-containing protein [Armatimonadota bacterium]